MAWWALQASRTSCVMCVYGYMCVAHVVVPPACVDARRGQRSCVMLLYHYQACERATEEGRDGCLCVCVWGGGETLLAMAGQIGPGAPSPIFGCLAVLLAVLCTTVVCCTAVLLCRREPLGGQHVLRPGTGELPAQDATHLPPHSREEEQPAQQQRARRTSSTPVLLQQHQRACVRDFPSPVTPPPGWCCRSFCM